MRSRRGHLPDTVLWDSITWQRRLRSSMTPMSPISLPSRPSKVESTTTCPQFFPQHVFKHLLSDAPMMTDVRQTGTTDGTTHSGWNSSLALGSITAYLVSGIDSIKAGTCRFRCAKPCALKGRGSLPKSPEARQCSHL